jgi:hypothetical protein
MTKAKRLEVNLSQLPTHCLLFRVTSVPSMVLLSWTNCQTASVRFRHRYKLMDIICRSSGIAESKESWRPTCLQNMQSASRSFVQHSHYAKVVLPELSLVAFVGMSQVNLTLAAVSLMKHHDLDEDSFEDGSIRRCQQ